MYLKATNGNDRGLRELVGKKNNYGSGDAESTLLRWKNGVFTPDPRVGSLERMAAERKVDDLFLDILRRFTAQGRNVSDKKSPSYAPAVLVDEPEAKAAKLSKKQLTEAMTRLFAAGKIAVHTEGPPSHPRTRIVEKNGGDTP